MSAPQEKMIDLADLENTTFRRAPNKLQTELDGEMVLLDVESSQYSGLNEIGTLIWQELTEPVTFFAIRSKILAEYAVDEKRCTEDLIQFLEEMLSNKLVETTDNKALSLE